jgi:hypothetical protein
MHEDKERTQGFQVFHNTLNQKVYPNTFCGKNLRDVKEKLNIVFVKCI